MFGWNESCFPETVYLYSHVQILCKISNIKLRKYYQKWLHERKLGKKKQKRMHIFIVV